MIWLWCSYAQANGHLSQTLRAVKFDGERGRAIARDDKYANVLGVYQASRVFEGLSWTNTESATLRTALKAHGGKVDVGRWNEVVVVGIALKLIEAIERSAYTQEELENLIWQNS